MDVTLRTRRLTLRQPHPDDVARVARLMNNFRVAGNLSRVPYPYAEADASAWLRGRHRDDPPDLTTFAVELAGEGLIGHCGFHPEAQRTVIGYWLGEPFWNRGFMSEAAVAILDWYFTVTVATHVGSGAFYFNRASLAVQRKLGFTETGSSYRLCLARRQELRHIDTELTRARWSEQPGRVGQSQVAASS
jgi:RimJ/RimL family protein N-acetyltransferase